MLIKNSASHIREPCRVRMKHTETHTSFVRVMAPNETQWPLKSSLPWHRSIPLYSVRESPASIPMHLIGWVLIALVDSASRKHLCCLQVVYNVALERGKTFPKTRICINLPTVIPDWKTLNVIILKCTLRYETAEPRRLLCLKIKGW